jgi:hypothetical protein
MVSLKKLKSGKESGGSIKAVIIKVSEPRKAGDYEITDVTVDDGTDRMVISIFDCPDDIETGKIFHGKVYVKDYKGKKTLNIPKKAKVWVTDKDDEDDDDGDEDKDDDDEDDDDKKPSKSKSKSSDKSSDKSPKASPPSNADLVKAIKGLTSAIEDFKVDLLSQLQVNAGIKKTKDKKKKTEPLDLEADKKKSEELTDKEKEEIEEETSDDETPEIDEEK